MVTVVHAVTTTGRHATAADTGARRTRKPAQGAEVLTGTDHGKTVCEPEKRNQRYRLHTSNSKATTATVVVTDGRIQTAQDSGLQQIRDSAQSAEALTGTNPGSGT